MVIFEYTPKDNDLDGRVFKVEIGAFLNYRPKKKDFIRYSDPRIDERGDLIPNSYYGIFDQEKYNIAQLKYFKNNYLMGNIKINEVVESFNYREITPLNDDTIVDFYLISSYIIKESLEKGKLDDTIRKISD